MDDSDDFYKPKPLKLRKPGDEPPPKEEAATEPIVNHFKPIKKESAYSARNLLGLLVPIVVTAGLVYGGYKGVVFYRDLSTRADAADRDARAAGDALMRQKQETANFEAKAAEIDRSLPQLIDRIRAESTEKARAKYRADIAETIRKTEIARQEHAMEALKKQEQIERIAHDKVARAKADVEKATKALAEASAENAELKTFLRANKRTMRGDV